MLSSMFKLLFSAKRAERHPIEMLFVGFVYSSISLLLSYFIFSQYASLIMVFFSVLSCIYVSQKAIAFEESEEEDFRSECSLLKKHSRILIMFLFMFLGFVLSFSLWSAVLPNNTVSVMFDLQSSVVDGIRATSLTGNATKTSSFFMIISNNLKVLGVSLVLALLYGAGAIFVLVWNASVLGFVIGTLAKSSLGVASLPVAFAKYFLHGIPEMMAYFVIALAGGILYVSFLKDDFLKVGKNKRLFSDVLILIFLSIFILIAAALLEVYISPFL